MYRLRSKETLRRVAYHGRLPFAAPLACDVADAAGVLHRAEYVPDSMLEYGHARYTIESDAGALVQVDSKGVRHGPPEVLARMAKGYFASDDAERLEASRVSALRTYKPQDIWGFREATFKGRKIIPIGTPGPAVPPPLVQIAPPPPPQQPQLDLPEEDGWDDDDQDLVAEIWEALDFIATAATGKASSTPRKPNNWPPAMIAKIAPVTST